MVPTENLSVEQKQVMERAMMVRAMIGEIPVTKRTEKQATSYNEATRYIQDHFNQYLEVLAAPVWRKVTEEAEAWRANPEVPTMELLAQPGMTPPVLSPTNILDPEIDEFFASCYAAENTLQTAFEAVVITQSRWQRLEKRVRAAFKSVMNIDTDHKANSMYDVFVPDAVHEAYDMLDDLKVALQMRKENFATAREIVSRLVTNRQNVLRQPFRGSGDSAFGVDSEGARVRYGSDRA